LPFFGVKNCPKKVNIFQASTVVNYELQPYVYLINWPNMMWAKTKNGTETPILRTENCQLRTANRQLRTANCELQTANRAPPTANCKPPTAHRQLKTAN
jgi:hypothetical protein